MAWYNETILLLIIMECCAFQSESKHKTQNIGRGEKKSRQRVYVEVSSRHS